MNIEEFVSQTLQQITNGIVKAQEATAATGARINPAGSLGIKQGASVLQTDTDAMTYVTDVEFDIAVTAGNEQASGANAGIKVMGMSLGAKADVKYENEAVSRVQFKVPVAWPGQRDLVLETKIKEKSQQRLAAAEARRANRRNYAIR